MKTFLASLICGLICASCTMGIRNIERPDGTKETGPYMELGQLQTMEGYNTIYTSKGAGWDSEIPIPYTGGHAVLKLAFGYFNITRVLLMPDATLVLDVVIDPFNKGAAVTDTLIYGKDAIEEYAKFFEVDVGTDIDTSIEPDSSEEPEPEREGDSK